MRVGRHRGEMRANKTEVLKRTRETVNEDDDVFALRKTPRRLHRRCHQTAARPRGGRLAAADLVSVVVFASVGAESSPPPSTATALLRGGGSVVLDVGARGRTLRQRRTAAG